MAIKPKIAIIEDDLAIADMYRFKLQQNGYEIRIAHDGIEGLQLIKAYRPLLILLDLMMPRMTGEAVLEELRKAKWGSTIRVIILTNVSKDEAPSNLRLLNVDRYIVKAHYTATQVVTLVEEVLDK
jgi:two-component system response regulator VanR